MEFMNVIHQRRSIRKFKPEPIPPHVIDEILEAGRLAPSAMNLQNWHFGIITDEDLKQQLVPLTGGQEFIATAPVIIALCATFDTDLPERSDDDIMAAALRARLGDGFVDYLNAFPDRTAVRTLMHHADVFIPGQQIALAAESLGLASCWIGWVDSPRAHALLNLPDDTACLYLLPIGYPDETPEPVTRKNLDEITFHNTFTR